MSKAKKGIFSALLIICLSLCQTQALLAQTSASNSKLARLKTALIFNFTKNVFWPLEDQMKEFRIVVMQSERLADELQLLESLAKFRKQIPFKVILCKDASALPPCHMLVVDAASGENLWSLYAKIRYKPVLMVAENLQDYQKSMVSFMVNDGNLKYIVNKTKLEESRLFANKDFFASAITREGEWNSIFEKFSHLLKQSAGQVKVDKDDIAQMMNEYKALEHQNKGRQYTIMSMEDSLQSKMRLLDQKVEEYNRVSEEIAQKEKVLAGLKDEVAGQKKAILLKETEIGKQRIVIGTIAGLTIIVLMLLLLAIRVNRQRRKANKLLSVQKSEIERQKHLVESKQKEILDSIYYAKRIQTALMASESLLNTHLPDHFVMFRPKDIVAGDFYWAEEVNGTFMYATADSTGHGVPGAFMSLLNISKLNEAVNQKRIMRPDLVLNDVKQEIVEALNPKGSTEESKEGMDVVLCRLDTTRLTMQYAAANSSFCIVRGNEMLNLKADKMPVGKSHNDSALFTFNELQLHKGDIIYTFTDGLADQFGGPQGKKLKLKYLKNILLKISALSMTRQKETLERYFDDWKGNLEQVDDVLIIGVRV